MSLPTDPIGSLCCCGGGDEWKVIESAASYGALPGFFTLYSGPNFPYPMTAYSAIRNRNTMTGPDPASGHGPFWAEWQDYCPLAIEYPIPQGNTGLPDLSQGFTLSNSLYGLMYSDTHDRLAHLWQCNPQVIFQSPCLSGIGSCPFDPTDLNIIESITFNNGPLTGMGSGLGVFLEDVAVTDDTYHKTRFSNGNAEQWLTKPKTIEQARKEARALLDFVNLDNDQVQVFRGFSAASAASASETPEVVNIHFGYPSQFAGLQDTPTDKYCNQITIVRDPCDGTVIIHAKGIDGFGIINFLPPEKAYIRPGFQELVNMDLDALGIIARKSRVRYASKAIPAQITLTGRTLGPLTSGDSFLPAGWGDTAPVNIANPPARIHAPYVDFLPDDYSAAFGIPYGSTTST